MTHEPSVLLPPKLKGNPVARGELCLRNEGPELAVRGEPGPIERNLNQSSSGYPTLGEQAIAKLLPDFNSHASER